jgi:multiple sugar transport system substrate-binding protein
MTGLEKPVHTDSDSHQALRRYLTLFYGLTLGLAIVLALLAIAFPGDVTPSIAAITQTGGMSQTAIPTQRNTQIASINTTTPLPAIPSTPNEKTPSSLGVTSEELRGLMVSLWHPWTGAAEAGLQTILDEFNRTNRWGITVQARAYEGFGKLDEAVETALTAEALPDVILDYGYQARHWDNYNALVDLTPYINDPVWGLTSDELADFYPGFWDEDLVAQGNSGEMRRLAVPYYRSAYLLFYNQSWARELGYPNLPTTPEDFRVRTCAAAEYVSKNGNKSTPGKGGWLVITQPGELLGWMYAFGGEVTDAEGAGYLFDTPETRQAFGYLKGLQESGCAWAESEGDLKEVFASRQALFVVGSLFDIPDQQEAFDLTGSTDEWIVIPFPSKRQPAVDAYGPSIMVTRSTPPEQLAAWLVIDWLVYPAQPGGMGGST